MTVDQDVLYQRRNLYIWFLLAFQGGALDAGGYLAVHRFVSHVTGFVTMAGIAGAGLDWLNMIVMFLIPVAFLTGVVISAWNTERRRIYQQLPRYGLIFSLMILSIFMVAFLGGRGFFGEFGSGGSQLKDYALMFILAFTCGLQNAVISSASGSFIRTTHLTGPTTDFGIGLVRLWSTRKSLSKHEVFATWCRFGIYWSFVLGALVAANLHQRFKFNGFYLPLAISLYTAMGLRSIHKVRIVKNTASL